MMGRKSDLCLGIPYDHRLKPLLGIEITPPTQAIEPENHAREIRHYGRRLQNSGRRSDVTDNEINFARWLALPETKGGFVIVLEQPAQHQQYFSDHQQTIDNCVTLKGIDEVCRAVTGSGLEKVSCFDAFPFHKRLVKYSLETHQKELDEAYAVFLEMIEKKQPDVILCCYRSSHSTKYQDFEAGGIGQVFPSTQRRQYMCVNAFHPSYALNHVGGNAALRTLLLLEAAQAFHRAYGTWRESLWMDNIRKYCADIVREEKRRGTRASTYPPKKFKLLILACD